MASATREATFRDVRICRSSRAASICSNIAFRLASKCVETALYPRLCAMVGGVVTERKLKGINFRGLTAALERRPGVDVSRVLAAVAGPAGEALRAGEIVAGGWYPASYYDALLAAVEASFPREPM